MEIKVNLTPPYTITLERGIINSVNSCINTNRKVLVAADSNIPKDVVDTLLSQIPNGISTQIESGEKSKSFTEYERLSALLLENNFHREDLIIALGGGVTGDLAGFAAATYMRGIDFVNIPTTTLSQIDSSIGGKTAINLNGTKNIIGAFHQPSAVLIDTELLSTLPRRQFNNGLVEALKAGLIYDRELYEIFLNREIDKNLDEIIQRSLLVKKAVVEADEKETGLRKILNFGHTVGHALEHQCNLLHGEAVAVGMLPMIEDALLREEVKGIINNKLHINTAVEFDRTQAFETMLKDKKASVDKITVVKVKHAGEAVLEKASFEDCRIYLNEAGV